MTKLVYKSVCDQDGNLDATKALHLAVDLLRRVLQDSRHIVFSSPAPSSTEALIRSLVESSYARARHAMDHLDIYNKGR
jgi:hypothetical protein